VIDGLTPDPDGEDIAIVLDDGSVEITIGEAPLAPATGDETFDENLAERLSDAVLAGIAVDLLQAIDNDDASRQEWLAIQQDGVKLLGFEIEKPSNSASTTGGVSKIRHPLLAEAVTRFQSTSLGELLPADGPVKTRVDGRSTPDEDVIANALQQDMNHYLTSTATEYYPDTDQMLFWVGLSGSAFKKVYHDPIRRRPVSISINSEDFILSPDTKPGDLYSGSRRTHRIRMRQALMKRMQLVGAYRNIEIPTPSTPQTNALDDEKSAVSGISVSLSVDDRDREYEVLECYCDLDIEGLEHLGPDGKPDGLPVPYKVTIERDSQTVLEIRRNWDEGDPLCLPKQHFVQYVYIPAIGPYGIGLVHLLANTAIAATSGWREMLDAGMFANFPGFLYAKGVSRQNTSDFSIPPGHGMPVETNGMSIRDAVMPLPYKEPGPAMMQLVDGIINTGKALGGTAEMATGNGNSQAPVGTTVALLEQSQVNVSAVHKRLHAAQAREFQLLRDRFREDPEAFWRFNPHKAREWSEAELLAALDNVAIVPAADPNTAGSVQRALKASAVIQMAQQDPEAFNRAAVIRYALGMLNIASPETLLNLAPAEQGPSPVEQAQQQLAEARMMEAQTRARKVSVEETKVALDAAAKREELAFKKESLVVNAGVKVATEMAKRADTETQFIETLSDEANRRLLNGVQ